MHVTYHPILAAGVLTDFRYVVAHIGNDCMSVDNQLGLRMD